jgi:sulfide:quinone oxidoreductase
MQSKVAIVGGGVAALEAALALRELARELVEVELLAPDRRFAYQPLLVAEPFGAGEVKTFPLPRLADAAGASLTEAIVTGVDSDRHVVRTAAGDEHAFDLLLLAPGAVPRQAVPGAISFRGPRDAEALGQLLADAAAGTIDHVTFAVPSGTTWPLPLYELALLTRSYLVDEGAVDVSVALVTPEDAPLGLFGHSASDAVGELLEARSIELSRSTTPLAFADGALSVAPAGALETDRVVALPRLEGPRLAGVLHDTSGFIPTDAHGQVGDEIDVWAAGDATAFPLKQGGVATQQADAAAEAIAARAGADVEPQPFRPVLRGLLLTGMAPRFLRAEPQTRGSVIDTEPLWWPPAKIVGRHLAPFLAERLGLAQVLPDAAQAAAVRVEVELTPSGHGAWSQI